MKILDVDLFACRALGTRLAGRSATLVQYVESGRGTKLSPTPPGS